MFGKLGMRCMCHRVPRAGRRFGCGAEPSTRAIRVVTAEAGASADLAARPLAVTSAQPSTLFRGLPAVAAAHGSVHNLLESI